MKQLFQTTVEEMSGELVWQGVLQRCKPGQLFFVAAKKYRVVSSSIEKKQQFIRAATLGA